MIDSSSVKQSIEAQPLYAGIFVALVLNSLSGRMASFFSENDADVAASLLGINAIIWFALFGLCKIGLDGQQTRSVDRFDWMVAWLSVAIMILPLKTLSVFWLPVVAFYIFGRSLAGGQDRRLGMVALALTGPTFWGPVTQALLGNEITLIETQLLAAVTNLETNGNVLHSVDGDTLVIAGGCSSFANITLALLLVTTFWQMMGMKNDRRLAIYIALAVASVIFINSTRLAILGFFPQDFGFWHEGMGQTLFMWGMLLVIALIAMIGVSRAAHRQV